MGVGADIRGGRVTRKEVRFSVTYEEWLEITRYVADKKRWKQVSHFARDCVFKTMGQNPVGRHDNRGGEPTDRSEGK